MISVLGEWSLPVWLTSSIAVTALVYVRGWFLLRRTRRDQFSGSRLLSFLIGVVCLWIAIASPLEVLADELLSAHMIEHLILMSIVPPLILLGLPFAPLLRGLPKTLRKWVASPLLRVKPLRRIWHWLLHPLVAWLAMNVALLAWHVPSAYDFALEHEAWHDFEHICFLSTSLLFWWCVIRPWPATRQRHRWSILIYLVGADIANTALSAFLAFCNRPVYAYYISNPNPFQADPLRDQVLGAVIMWVVGSIVFLIPAAAITFSLLQPTRTRMLSRVLSRQ
jgi:putative membrane protein